MNVGRLGMMMKTNSTKSTGQVRETKQRGKVVLHILTLLIMCHNRMVLADITGHSIQYKINIVWFQISCSNLYWVYYKMISIWQFISLQCFLFKKIVIISSHILVEQLEKTAWINVFAFAKMVLESSDSIPATHAQTKYDIITVARIRKLVVIAQFRVTA